MCRVPIGLSCARQKLSGVVQIDGMQQALSIWPAVPAYAPARAFVQGLLLSSSASFSTSLPIIASANMRLRWVSFCNSPSCLAWSTCCISTSVFQRWNPCWGNAFFTSEIVDPLARMGGSQYADFWSSGGFLSFYFAESFPYSQANYLARGSVIIDTVTLNSVFSAVKPRSRGFRLFLFMITKLYFVLSKCRTAD